MTTDPNPTPVPGTYFASGEAAVLQDQIAARVGLAKKLFEAQFAFAPGGRMPADPVWDDLDSSAQKDFEDEARRAWHVFGPELDELRADAQAANVGYQNLVGYYDDARTARDKALGEVEKCDTAIKALQAERDALRAVRDELATQRDEARAEVARLSSGDTGWSDAMTAMDGWADWHADRAERRGDESAHDAYGWVTVVAQASLADPDRAKREIFAKHPATDEEPTPADDIEQCPKCRSRPALEGAPGEFCERCIDVCHDATEFDHSCAVCRWQPPTDDTKEN